MTDVKVGQVEKSASFEALFSVVGHQGLARRITMRRHAHVGEKRSAGAFFFRAARSLLFESLRL